MIHNLSKATKTLVISTGITAGSSNNNPSTTIDTLGYSAVRIMALLGTLTSTQVTSLGVNQSDDNSSWDTGASTNKTGNAGDSDAGKLLILDIYKPKKRYLQVQVNRATANAVITAIIAELWLADFMPVTDTTSISKLTVLDCV